MTGADLLQIGAGLGTGIAGTLLAFLKLRDKKRTNGNGYLTKDVFQASVREIVDTNREEHKELRRVVEDEIRDRLVPIWEELRDLRRARE